MKLKTVEIEGKTYAEVDGDKPIYLEDDGKEVAFDAAGTRTTIDRITGESKKFKERAQTAEESLKAFEGIDDPKAAKDALAKVKNFGDKELVEAGKVEEMKAEAIKAVEEKYKPVVEERDRLKGDLYNEKIGGSFARSPLIVGDKAKFSIPADMVQARFGGHFAIEDGKITAKDASGNLIYSRASPGEAAPFDEALEILVDGYPYKDSILKGTGGGSGGKQGNGSGQGGAKTISRADFDAMGLGDRAAKMKDGFKVVDE